MTSAGLERSVASDTTQNEMTGTTRTHTSVRGEAAQIEPDDLAGVGRAMNAAAQARSATRNLNEQRQALCEAFKAQQVTAAEYAAGLARVAAQLKLMAAAAR